MNMHKKCVKRWPQPDCAWSWTTATRSCRRKSAKRNCRKYPYMLVVGGKEAEARTVSVRHRSKGDQGARPLSEFVEALQQEVKTRATN